MTPRPERATTGAARATGPSARGAQAQHTPREGALDGGAAPDTPAVGSGTAVRTALVLGESKSGKTHYGAQLVGRMNQSGGRLGMRGAAADLTPFEEALGQLNRGLAAAHTPSGQYRQVVLPLTDRETGAALDLAWPDYAGEQVSRLVDDRDVPAAWRERLTAADAWVLLIRLHHATTPADMVSRPAADVTPPGAPSGAAPGAVPGVPSNGAAPSVPAGPAERTDGVGFRWSDQARAVELLQLLLAARRVGTARGVAAPRLVVLLSCWDELGAGPAPSGGFGDGAAAGPATPPAALLEERAPLLANYLAATWRPEALEIYGLSALGRDLAQDRPDEAFVDRGPEAFGYVVLPDGTSTRDLTAPLVRFAEGAPAPSAGQTPPDRR